MAAAQQLRRAGHAVTLFERDESAGGLMRFGVPDFKIEKTVIERRVRAAARRGRRAALGVDVGVDVTVEELRERSTPSSSSTGSRVPRDLPVPGRELEGVHFAMDYLYARNRRVSCERPDAAGHDPADAASPPRARTSSSSAAATPAPTASGNSIREGAVSVVQLELLPEPPANRPDDRTPWPLWPAKYRLSYAMEEATTRSTRASRTSPSSPPPSRARTAS